MGAKLEQAKRVARRASPWLCRVARLGYVAKGVVYLAIAGFALRLANGHRARPDAEAAFDWLARGPWGVALLGLMAVGLVGYGLWRIAAGLATDDRPLNTRLGVATSGFAHLGLAGLAVQPILGYPFGAHAGGGGGGSERVAYWSAWFMGLPGGDLLVGGVGAWFIGSGIWQMYSAAKGDAARGVDVSRLAPEQAQAVGRMGAAGFAARGLAFGLIGGFLVQAALQHAPQRARGYAGAIASLLEMPEGRALVALVAIAFAAYGLFMFVKARSPALDPLAAGD